MKLLAILLSMLAWLSATGQGFNKAEYFFDADPGLGNGTQITLSGNRDTIRLTPVVATNALSAGTHLMGLRVQNNAGYWGLTESRSFYIYPIPDNLSDITGIEYFFDNDPGPGNATPLNFATPLADFKGTILLPIENLPIGNHQLVIRVKNSDQKWSLMENRTFKVCTTNGPKSIMNFHIQDNKVFFTNSSTGADSTKWLFGDNTNDTVLNPVKTYAGIGNYQVKLISTNACGKDTLIRLVSINGLQHISGKYGSDTGIATITFDGFGLNSSTPIKIVKGNKVYIPVHKQFLSSNRIVGYFNFAGADTGQYHAVINLTATAFDTLQNAYNIIPFKKARVFISGALGPQMTRPGLQYRSFVLQNEGTEDAIMVPAMVLAGYKAGIACPQMYPQDEQLNIVNEGIFKNTYQYLTSQNISADAMQSFNIDTAKNRQLYATYKIRIPANTNVQSRVLFIGNPGNLTYEASSSVLSPLYNSQLVTGNTQNNMVDCMNSFLRKAVRNNLAVTLNNAGWNTCFNTAYDTLTKTIKAISQDIEKSQKSIPIKAVFSALLAQIAQCNASGLPVNISSASFNKIINDVTYNWIFWENLDSLGRPCMDTTETFVFPNNLFSKNKTAKTKGKNPVINSVLEAGPCDALLAVPELLDMCMPWIKICGIFSDLTEYDDFLEDAGLPTVGDVLKLGPAENLICKLNSAAVTCIKLCEGNSADPNVKNGPGDNSKNKYINSIQNNTYTIMFENLSTTIASAAFVEIRDTIDKTKLDIATLQLGSFGWGDSIKLLEPNITNYSILKDLRPLRPNKLRIDFRLDTASGVASWKFFTVDTSSLQLTINPAEGFLPPNVNGKDGVGFVSFSIHPKQGVTSGDAVQNKASIVFDNNAPIITPVWEHIFDTTRPQSQVSPLPVISSNKNFLVRWGGADAHAGIASYSVYYSVNDSAFKNWKRYTTQISDTFQGQYNKRYKFYSIALDRANNFELPPDSAGFYPDAFTTPVIPLPLQLLSLYAAKLPNQNQSKLQWRTTNEINTAYFNVERSTNGNNFTRISKVLARNSSGNNNYLFIDSFPNAGINYYKLNMVDIDQQHTYSSIVTVNFNKTNQVSIYPVLVGDYFLINGVNINDNIQIIDELGRVYNTFKTTQPGQLISASMLARGVYWVKVLSAGNLTTIKIIKQ